VTEVQDLAFGLVGPLTAGLGPLIQSVQIPLQKVMDTSSGAILDKNFLKILFLLLEHHKNKEII